MAYLTECQVCNHQLEVADPATVPGLQCPACSSQFSMLPAKPAPRPATLLRTLRHADPEPTEPPATPLRPAVPQRTAQVDTQLLHSTLVATPAATPPPAAPAVPPPVGILVTSGDKVTVARTPAPPRPARRALPEPDFDTADSLGATALAGVGSLLLGGVALAGIWVPWLSGLSVPLSGFGLLLGLTALVLSRDPRQPRFLSGLGALACAGVLSAFLLPGLWDSVAQRFRQRAALDMSAIRVVPLTGYAVDPDLEHAEWVDASRAALQKDYVGVQVVSVTLGPIEVQEPPKRKPVPPESYLTVRLRSQRLPDERESVKQRDERATTAGEPQVTLTDEAGRVYRQVPAAPEPRVPGQARLRPIRVGQAGEDVFVFEPPPAEVKTLHLEIAAAAWGGTGTLKFAIPRSMIRTAPTRGHRAGPARGA
jgi:hypothetical protein